MSRPISRYPGDVPVADFFNYDNPEFHDPVPFTLTAENVDLNVIVTFWDVARGCEIVAAKTGEDGARLPGAGGVTQEKPDPGSVPGDLAKLDGRVGLPGPGLYQLVLRNPNTRAEAQPFWILWRGPVCEECEGKA